MLLNKYFTIASHQHQANSHLFELDLLPDCEVYQGHFPGNPVSPGVCSLQMIKECAESILGKPLFLSHINQCRYTALITPSECPQIQLQLSLSENEGVYQLIASLGRNGNSYLELKAQATAE